MKTTTFIAILLTFLMLLLVLMAAVTFLWQGREDATRQIGELQEERRALQATATLVRSYLVAREEGLATAQAGGTVVAQALTRAETTAAALDATRMGIAAERAALATRTVAQDALLSQPPALAIISPEPDTLLAVSETAAAGKFVVAGSHPQGIHGLQLRLAGDNVTLAGEGAPFRVFTHTLPAPLPPGLYTVTATITATNDLTATTTSSFQVWESEGPLNEGVNAPESGLLLPPARPLAGVLQTGRDPVDGQKNHSQQRLCFFSVLVIQRAQPA